ncbi:alpha/beta hydrolase [Nocardia sp. NPDC050697]|uniref:alpha/beta hydrolase n=1 Tax=Nocardia sp. NPDC050697 TaxID=3155158 RepID=UPI0033F7450C
MSIRMHAAAGYLRATRKRGTSTPARTRSRLNAPKGTAMPPATLMGRHDVRERTVEGFRCVSVTPRGGAERGALYLHGGSYMAEIIAQHWELVGRLADAGVRVEVPIYGLAPDYTYHAAYPLVTAVYQELLDDLPAERVTIAGDSAGGGLALGFAQSLLGAGLPQPGRNLLISPWLDLTLANPAVRYVRDPWLNRVGLVECGLAWAGGTDPADPLLSPINGPLAGLAPTDVYIGTRDLLYPDVLRLRSRAEEAGTAVRVDVQPGGVHVYPLLPVPEGRSATERIVRTLGNL